jgi:hypothetical protein
MTEMPQFLDPGRPNVARVYDYRLDGTDHFEADRQLAERMLAVFPGLRDLVRENRQFITRAVRWVAEQGIGQFIDAGAGLPTSPGTHESVHAVAPEALVAYVDNDPVVVGHARVLLTEGDDRVSVTQADLRDPAAVLAASGADAASPACLILAAVLHLMDAAAAREVAAGYVSRLAPGSYVIITTARYDDPVLAARITEMYADAASFYNHTLTDAESFFSGLDLVVPGLVSGGTWHAGTPDPGRPRGKVYALAGVGRKPDRVS